MRQFVRSIGLMLVAVALFGTVASPAVSAQSNGLGITPRKDYIVKAGEQINDKLFISNLSQKDNLQVSVRTVDFKAQDETGTPALELDANAPQTPWSLKPFIKIANKLTIPAGKSAYLPFSLQIPVGQGAGSYYSAIEYVAENSETQQKVNIAASSASLIFVTVPGKANEQLRFKQFGAYTPGADGKEGSFSSLFLSSPPDMLAYRLQNKGNVAEQPQGSIVIKNIFGKKVKTITTANPRRQLALRGQTRRFETCISSVKQTSATKVDGGQAECKPSGLAPGRYSADLAIFYGLNGNNTQEISASTSFWYLPWWSIALLVLAILVVAATAFLLYRKFSGNRARFKLPRR